MKVHAEVSSVLSTHPRYYLMLACYFLCMQYATFASKARTNGRCRVCILLNSLTEGIGHFQSIRDLGTIGITFKGIILFWKNFRCYFYQFQPFLKVPSFRLVQFFIGSFWLRHTSCYSNVSSWPISSHSRDRAVSRA